MIIQKIVIAGAGTMGSSMAQIYAEYFDDVILYNHRQETLELAKERIESNVATLVETGNLTKEKAGSLLGALSYTTSMECFKTCDFVAENLSENLEIKDDFYKKLSEVISNTAVITTNTSGMSINLLSRSVKWPERFIGMHWFNPPHLVPLIEIIKGEKTREDVAQTVYDLSLKIGKKPVLVNRDIPGFAANRLQFAILREALDLVQFHWWDFDVPGMMETAFDLVRLQEKGKIRNIGMCNMDTNALKQMVDAGIPVVSNQAQYSVFDRRPERTLLDYSAEHGIYTFAYGTLAGGFLAERYMGKAYEAPETRSQVKYMQIIEDSLGWDGMQKLLPVLKSIADHHGVSIANVATQYILNQKSVGAVMVGTRNSKHVQSNLQTLAFDLTEDEMKQIRDFVNQYPTPEGECYELERTSPRYKGIILTDRNHLMK